MTDRSRLVPEILAAAVLLGLAADLLLRALPWGINLSLWTALLALAATVLIRRTAGRGGRRSLWPFVLTALAAAAFLWRDSPVLAALDFLVILGSLSLTAFRSPPAGLRSALLTDYALASVAAGLHTGFGFVLLLFTDVQWSAIDRRSWSRGSAAVVRGLLLAVPLLIVFGALFVAADAAFAGIVTGLVQFDLSVVLAHCVVLGCFAWLTGGYLRGFVLAPTASDPPSPPRQSLSLDLGDNAITLDTAVGSGIGVARGVLSLGTVEIATALGLLDLLFLAFVAVQFRYFFGGAPLVQTSTTLTYAEYARRGFFELVTAAALALPLLLLADWLARPRSSGERRLLRALAGALILLLSVIMVSAIQRMRLYQSEYGLTELRVYTTAFMVWLGMVFLWFAVTVLPGRRDWFASGAIAAAMLAVATLEALNPDTLIARANVARIQAGQSFDAAYAASLSADSVPVLLEALPAMDRSQRCVVARGLVTRWGTDTAPDWRTWNWSRTRARQYVQAKQEVLKRQQC